MDIYSHRQNNLVWGRNFLITLLQRYQGFSQSIHFAHNLQDNVVGGGLPEKLSHFGCEPKLKFKKKNRKCKEPMPEKF